MISADGFLLGSIFVEGSSRKGKGNHHRPSEEETKTRDEKLFVYKYNQGGESLRRDNRSKPYPSLVRIRERFQDRNSKNDSFRELGLGDVVMGGKERWRKLVTLGAEGVLPGRYIESFLRVFKQFTHT